MPDLTTFSAIFNQLHLPLFESLTISQSRLMNGLIQFCDSRIPNRFMLLTAQEDEEYFHLISDAITKIFLISPQKMDNPYMIRGIGITSFSEKKVIENAILTYSACTWQSWVEYEQLFGTMRCYKDVIVLQPGLIHRANGSILMLGANTFINQPILWFRLKQMIIQQRFDWLSESSDNPFPIFIPSISLNIRLIVIGDRKSLANLNDIDQTLTQLAMYGEFESKIGIHGIHEMEQWCNWVNMLANLKELPALNINAWPELIKQAVRYSGDKFYLPLCPQWITRCLKEASLYSCQTSITEEALSKSNSMRTWRKSYLSELMKEDIIGKQIMIETEGKVVGQVNALSILDIPGHPMSFGEPSRISCVIHFGDGEINDVERKVELGGNIHAKSVMIIRAFLMSALKLEQLLPFSASLVFEQSYEEIDGDSASLAELVALISALSDKPVNQQIAVTGSIDQFGRIQPIGSINEKIEGFFFLCKSRGFTGKQGVIIPTANIRHLCLNNEVILAVQKGQFSLWPLDRVDQALEVLISMPFDHDTFPNLINLIRERIEKNINLYHRKQLPWGFRWLHWFC